LIRHRQPRGAETARGPLSSVGQTVASTYLEEYFKLNFSFFSKGHKVPVDLSHLSESARSVDLRGERGKIDSLLEMALPRQSVG
jgi:hypothetical protein